MKWELANSGTEGKEREEKRVRSRTIQGNRRSSAQTESIKRGSQTETEAGSLHEGIKKGMVNMSGETKEKENCERKS